MMRLKILVDGVPDAKGRPLEKGALVWFRDQLAQPLLDSGKATLAQPRAPTHTKVVRPKNLKRS
jgi:hypothetical protein